MHISTNLIKDVGYSLGLTVSIGRNWLEVRLYCWHCFVIAVEW